MTTEEQLIDAVLEQNKAVAEAIQELKEVPSGHLYAMVCGHIGYDRYQAIIGTLKRAGLIKVENHLIVWIGVDTAIDQWIGGAK